jgi:heat-inducible transcriptional repressor
MCTDRRMLVLRAVVEDYIRYQEPVGSTTVAKAHKIGVSPATVRNDMAALEDEGYLVQPHTSAGRIPTQKGYRCFVDRLAKLVPLSPAQRNGIDSFLSGSVNLEDVLQRSARLLAQITGQVAVVASPALSKSRLRRIELIPISSTTILLIVITDTGRVVQHAFSVSTSRSCEDILSDMFESLNTQCNGLTLHGASHKIRMMVSEAESEVSSELLGDIASVLEQMADEEESNSLFLAGQSQLTHRQSVPIHELAQLLDALEEQVVLMRLMNAQSELSQKCGGVSVVIGSETQTPGLMNASIVTSGYGHAKENIENQSVETKLDEGSPIAFVGSIGPTHMDYAATMSAVKAVAVYLTEFLSDTDGE